MFGLGGAELVFILIIGLIVFGPRKLPQMAKMAAKAMNEFRNVTDEFKQTWEREVSVEDIENETAKNLTEPEKINQESFVNEQNPIESTASNNNSIMLPEIKEVDKKLFTQNAIPETEVVEVVEKPEIIQTKRDWL